MQCQEVFFTWPKFFVFLRSSHALTCGENDDGVVEYSLPFVSCSDVPDGVVDAGHHGWSAREHVATLNGPAQNCSHRGNQTSFIIRTLSQANANQLPRTSVGNWMSFTLFVLSLQNIKSICAQHARNKRPGQFLWNSFLGNRVTQNTVSNPHCFMLEFFCTAPPTGILAMNKVNKQNSEIFVTAFWIWFTKNGWNAWKTGTTCLIRKSNVSKILSKSKFKLKLAD